MEDKVVGLITDHFGAAFFICVIVAAVAIFIVWWARGMYEKVKQIDNLPCKQNSDKIDEHIGKHSNVEVTITKLETSITYMQKSIDTLTQSLQSSNKIITDPFTQTHSPISITAKGQKMVERLKLDLMFDNNWEHIRPFIENNATSKNPYDIQQFCIEQAVVFPEKFLQEEQVAILKTDAYKTGIPLTSYMKVVAVMARDRYFKEHDIDVSEVDKTAPNK